MQTGSMRKTSMEDTRNVEEVELEDIESVSRRTETKRKGEEPESRKAKKRKFLRLEGWGEADDPSHGGNLDTWIGQDDTTVVRAVQVLSDDMIENETLAMMRPSKLMKKKVDISDGVRKKKFVFNTKGKLTKKEVVELKRTHKNNIFDWVS